MNQPCILFRPQIDTVHEVDIGAYAERDKDDGDT